MNCPFCAEEIRDAAILCRFCGAMKSPEGEWAFNVKGTSHSFSPLLVVTAIMSFGFLCLVCRQTADTVKHTSANIPTLPQSSTKESSFGTGLWRTLRETYPELRGDWLKWKELSGKWCIAIPDPFWTGLSSADKAQLARELDSVLGTTNWHVVTGRYMGSGKMMLDEFGFCWLLVGGTHNGGSNTSTTVSDM